MRPPLCERGWGAEAQSERYFEVEYAGEQTSVSRTAGGGDSRVKCCIEVVEYEKELDKKRLLVVVEGGGGSNMYSLVVV